MLVLLGADAFFDEAGLQVEELPRRDGGADERGEHQEVFGVEVQRRDDGFFGGEEPIGFGEDARRPHR